MSDFISKLSVYDLLARGVTGTIVLLAAEIFGVADILKRDTPVWAIVLAGYFCGLVLEEISYILEKMFGSRKRIESKIRKAKKYRGYNYEKCKAALIANDREIISDMPLSHIVMSSSFVIAFASMLAVKLYHAACIVWSDINFMHLSIRGSLAANLHSAGFLLAFAAVFEIRKRHYCRYRVERIFDYYIQNRFKTK